MWRKCQSVGERVGEGGGREVCQCECVSESVGVGRRRGGVSVSV